MAFRRGASHNHKSKIVIHKSDYDVRKIQKTDTTLEAKAAYYSLVSKLQKLRACGQ